MKIDIIDVSKRFGETSVLRDVNLSIGSGELVALLGPSGSGKTTLLRIIAGLEWPEAGEVRFDGQDALQRTVGERNVGFVFQSYALFRHMTVDENIAFGLRARPRARRPARNQLRERVAELLDIVQLEGLGQRYPNQLSGGQRQRVALARALAIDPQVLLLDEPFGALDAKVRKELRRWLRQLHDQIRVTSVFVTHDQQEAMEVADRIVILQNGAIEQIGTPEDIYSNSRTSFVHDFIGETVSIPVEVADGQIRIGALNAPAKTPDGPAKLVFRPYDISIVRAGSGALNGVVRRVYGFGATRSIDLELDSGAIIEIEVPRGQDLPVGNSIGISPQLYRIFSLE